MSARSDGGWQSRVAMCGRVCYECAWVLTWCKYVVRSCVWPSGPASGVIGGGMACAADGPLQRRRRRQLRHHLGQSWGILGSLGGGILDRLGQSIRVQIGRILYELSACLTLS